MWKKRNRASARPGLERLEGRSVPATFIVTTPLDAVAADGKLSLREAVSAANAHPGPDAIVLPAGVYRVAQVKAEDANAAGDFDVLDSTLFQGAGAGATVIDGQRVDRVFDVRGNVAGSINVAFQGLTIRNGFAANGEGGGIRVGNANLTVRDSVVTGNRALGDGGGVSNAALPGTGNVTLVRSIVNRNISGSAGGGLKVGGNAQSQGSVLTVVGSTIQRNLSSNDGGGIRAAVVNLTGSAVNLNHSGDIGGGVWADVANLTNSIIAGNFSENNTGGLLATTATLINSTVSGNHTLDVAGGLGVTSATLINSTVSGNTADDSGGINASSVTLVGSTVRGNLATRGSGGGIRATTATLTNSTVSGNSAAVRGGGILATNVTLLNATITENSSREGGGIYLWPNGTSSVRNSIIAENLVHFGGVGPDLAGAFTSAGHNLIGEGTGSTGFVNGGNGDMVGTASAPIDPRLAPLAFNGGRTMTHALLAGSPAIDRGDNAGAPAIDQRGLPRRKDGNGDRIAVADIGAFER